MDNASGIVRLQAPSGTAQIVKTDVYACKVCPYACNVCVSSLCMVEHDGCHLGSCARIAERQHARKLALAPMADEKHALASYGPLSY